MADPQRGRRRDLGGIALGALALFLAVSLVTQNPADPVDAPVWPLDLLYRPDVLVHPSAEMIVNECGYWGALVSGAMLSAIGVGSILVVGLLAMTAGIIITKGRVEAPVVRSLGWTLVLVAMVTAASLSGAAASGLPVVGAGGVLGAMTSTWLGDHFAIAGSWILTLTLLAFGLLLSTDYLLIHLGHKVIARGTAASIGGLKRARGAAGALPRRRITDVDDGVQLPGDTTSTEHPAIRIRGKQLDDDTPMVVAALPEDVTQPVAPSFVADMTSKVAGALGLGGAGSTRGGESPESGNASSAAGENPPATDAASDAVVEGDEAATTAVRDVEMAEETKQVRKDEEHSNAQLKIRNPSKRKDERQQLYDSLQDELPADADDYVLPPIDMLIESDEVCYEDQAKEVRRKATILEQTFKNFGFNIRVVEIETGPVIAQYEVELEAGLRLSKITGLADDLAIALRVPSVRIVAPIPGKNTVGIEVPNETRQVVRLREVIEECGTAARKMKIPIFLGKDVSGNSLTVDLASMPHLLIAGRTGTGKSVCLNAIISSILMTRRPDEVRMLMIDPKMVELSGYGRLPHLMHPVVTDMKKAEAILAWAVDKMEERYSLLAQVGVRHIASYNELGREELIRRLGIEDADQAKGVADHLPFIVIVADEMADLMMTAGKEVEQHIIRLAQKSRAVGIHLILATQKPTVDVITGLIKSNLPARISFQVASRTDSRVVLDENGADKLLGNGDMLFLWPGTSTLLRGQGTYLSDDEIDRVCGHCSMSEQNFVGELMNLKVAQGDEEEAAGPLALKKRDDLYESAIDVVIREGRGSCSLLQRALGIGYGRAARLIDFMAEDGIVGEYNGSQAREVILSIAEWESRQGVEPEASGAGPSEPEPVVAASRRTISRGEGWDDSDDRDPAGKGSEDAEDDVDGGSNKKPNPPAINWEEAEV